MSLPPPPASPDPLDPPNGADRTAAPGDVTRLLREVGDGDDQAMVRLMPLVYEELRRLASNLLWSERADHTLQPTALVHEAYMRLVDERDRNWRSRQHFMALAAMAMRRVLVNHARGRDRLKRGGGRRAVTIEAVDGLASPEGVDLVGLDDALDRLAAIDERKVRTVELRFFAGLPVDETAAVLGVSSATVKRDWELARAWLHREMAARD